MTNELSGPERAAELKDLRARLAEAEEVLRAIRSGEVDAVVVAGERGERVYTLSGADRIYRQLIETISEGAATLSADGVILYGNARLAEMLGRPLERVLGTALRNYLPPADRQALDAILAQARTAPSRRELNLNTSAGRLVPVYLSASRLQSEGAEMVFCLVLTDLTEQKRHEQIVAEERLARAILEQAAEAILVCDEQGRVIRASQAAQRFCDGNPLLRPFAEVFPLRTDASDPFQLAPVLQRKTLQNVDVVLERHGQELDFILNAAPLLSGQQILGCVVTLTDITKRRQAETQTRAAQAETQRLLALSEQSRRALLNAAEDERAEAEALLRAKEEWERTFDAVPDLIALIDADHRIFRANRAMAARLGTTPDQAVGCHCYEAVHGLSAPPDFCPHSKLLACGTEQSAEVTEDRLNGIFDVTTTPLHDEAGRFVGSIHVARDITERKRTEQALEESQRLYVSLVENLPQCVFRKDLQGRFTFVNAHFCRLLGKSATEILGRTDADFFPPELTEKYRRDDCRVLETGEPLDTIEENQPPNEEPRFVQVFKTPLRNANGEMIGLQCIFWDISDAKRAEAALRESEEQFRAMFELASVGMAQADPRIGQWLRVNQKLCAITGYSASEMLRLRVPEITHPDDRQHDWELFQRVVRGEAPDYRVEKRYVRKDGSIAWVNVNMTVIRDAAGQPLRTMATIEDISERKRGEEEIRRLNAELEQRVLDRTADLLAANKNLDAFSYSVSHDLRAPLRAIIGYASILREDHAAQLDSEGQRVLAVVASEGGRMGRLIDDLLAFARLGRQLLQRSPIDMEAMARTVFAELAGREPGRTLRLSLEPIPPARGDPAMVRQVWVNLLANAVKYTGTREVAEIKIGSRTEAGEITYFVQDNGVGFNMKYVGKLFGVFQRLHSEAEFAGTGVGLALVQRILHRHDGRIWADAAIDAGATFFFTLPTIAATDDKTDSP